VVDSWTLEIPLTLLIFLDKATEKGHLLRIIYESRRMTARQSEKYIKTEFFRLDWIAESTEKTPLLRQMEMDGIIRLNTQPTPTTTVQYINVADVHLNDLKLIQLAEIVDPLP
jgi:hypothetical protein